MTFLPIVERELRVAARRSGTYWLRFSTGLTIVLAMGFMLATNQRMRPADLAQEIFGCMSVMAMGFCLLAGVFLTADCLSAEKRDGTAGLLFLTDLRGYDVVLGKLAATSLHSCYALISIFPIMAIPLLMGGVTGGEFWRMTLVLLDTLFFSLAVGMGVSALTRDSRQAMAGALILIVTLVAILPALNELSNTLLKTGPIKWLLWPSPGYACLMTGDMRYRYRTGAHEFFSSVATVTMLSVFFLALASAVLPRAWQEKSVASRRGIGRGWWHRLRYGAGEKRIAMRTWLLAENPFHWLAARDRQPAIGAWMLCALAVLLGALFIFGTMTASGTKLVMFQIAIFTAIGAGLVFKCLVAVESSRRLNDDRQSGALELVLATPISVKQIIEGQNRGLNGHFALPMMGVMMLHPVLIWISYFSGWKGFSDNGISAMIFTGNMVVLATDMMALKWLGMWNGLRARHLYRAILLSLAQILVIPWAAYFAMMSLLAGSGRGLSNGTMVFFFCAWFAFGVVNDLFWAVRARSGLLREFRLRATGATSVPRVFPARPAGLEPATA